MTEIRIVKRMIGLLMVLGMVMGFISGCGGDSSTGPSEEITKWRKTFGKGWGNSVQQTVDGGFIVTGRDGDVFLFKTNELGNI